MTAPAVVVEGYDPRVGELVNADEGLVRHLGLWITYVSAERIEGVMDCDERHHQAMGIVNGGAWCTVVETLGSLGSALHAAAAGRVPVGVTNTTDFIRAHRGGPVKAVARPVHIGRSQQLWQVEITRDEDGKLVARGQVRTQSIETDATTAAWAAMFTRTLS